MRWGIMGNMMSTTSRRPRGIEHFFQQFTGPMTAWWKVLGQPVLTPECKRSSSTASMPRWLALDAELEAQRDEIPAGTSRAEEQV